MMLRTAFLTLATVALALSPAVRGQDGSSGGASRAADAVRLSVTRHQPLPVKASEYWLVPDLPLTSRPSEGRRDETAAQRFARGATLIAAGDFAAGLGLVDVRALAKTPLAAYAQYYNGVALLGLSRAIEADAAFTTVAAAKPKGWLKESIPLRIAEVALTRDDPERAVEVLDELSNEKLMTPEVVWLQLGRAAERAFDTSAPSRRTAAFITIFRSAGKPTRRGSPFPAWRRQTRYRPIGSARNGIARRGSLPRNAGRRPAPSSRRWRAWRKATTVSVIALRIAECDYYLDRFRAARDGLRPFLDDSSREAEARFFHLTATRALGDLSTYVQLARRLVVDHPDSPWTEETLNNLASHFIIVDDDEEADRVFRQLARSFPKSRYAERAAWRIGWRAYRAGNFREAAETFERAAAAFPARRQPAGMAVLVRASARAARGARRLPPTATPRGRRLSELLLRPPGDSSC